MIILLIIAICLIYVIYVYNSISSRKNIISNADSDIVVQLKRRYDLVDNLVQTVRGSVKFEQETLEKVVEARSKVVAITNGKDALVAEETLTSALRSLFALSENYPDLRSSSNFIELQRELTSLEDNIQAARRYFNATVREYNHLLVTFPSNIVANTFGFKPIKFFDIDQIQKENVKISF